MLVWQPENDGLLSTLLSSKFRDTKRLAFVGVTSEFLGQIFEASFSTDSSKEDLSGKTLIATVAATFGH
jgi:hypothetical protein